MEKLVALSVNDFIQILGSAEPAPGGGSAAALSAAVGASLTKMVAELTLDKKKYSTYEENTNTILLQAEALQKDLLQAIDEDTEAYNGVSAVFSMPKGSDEEKVKRQQAMAKALDIATQSPLKIMNLTIKALKVTELAIGKTNVNAASDLGVSALTLKAGLQGAWLNVLINLASLKDEQAIKQYRSQGESLLKEGGQLADQIYQHISANI